MPFAGAQNHVVGPDQGEREIFLDAGDTRDGGTTRHVLQWCNRFGRLRTEANTVDTLFGFGRSFLLRALVGPCSAKKRGRDTTHQH
jgi:hypothetical protein